MTSTFEDLPFDNNFYQTFNDSSWDNNVNYNNRTDFEKMDIVYTVAESLKRIESIITLCGLQLNLVFAFHLICAMLSNRGKRALVSRLWLPLEYLFHTSYFWCFLSIELMIMYIAMQCQTNHFAFLFFKHIWKFWLCFHINCYSVILQHVLDQKCRIKESHTCLDFCWFCSLDCGIWN